MPWIALYLANPLMRGVMWRTSVATSLFGLTEPIGLFGGASYQSVERFAPMLVRRRLARRPCVVPPDRAREPVIGREVQGNTERERSRTRDGTAALDGLI